MLENIDNLNINYYDSKNGDDVILFLHGWGSNYKIFEFLFPYLINDYRVVAVDLPGFGESAQLKESFSSDDYSSFCINFLKKLDLLNKKIVLVGHSNGGRIAIKLNLSFNNTINIIKNILIDSAGIRSKLSLYKRIKIKTFKFLKKISSFSLIKKIFPNLEENIKNKFGSNDYNNASPIMKETLVKLVNEDLSDKLYKINVPTLLIWGDKDDATPIEHAKIMNKNIKDSGLVIYENCSHFSFIENREKTILVFKSFLNIK